MYILEYVQPPVNPRVLTNSRAKFNICGFFSLKMRKNSRLLPETMIFEYVLSLV